MTTLEAGGQRTAAVPTTAGPESRRYAFARRWWVYVLLTLGLLITVVPFVWMLLGSLKTQSELSQVPPTWLPADPTFDNYSRMWNRLDFPRFFLNSAVIAGAITVANLVFTSMVGYALAKLRFAGRDQLFLLVLGTLLVPTSVTMVPLFVLISKLGLLDTYWAVILPSAAAPVGVFLMRQFMLSIPDDLIEAGRVDGASEWFIFWRIVMPLSVPALAANAIITFLPAWNALLWPLIVLQSQDKYTLPVALAIFAKGQFQADYGLLMAGSVVLVVPVIFLFLLLQKRFTQSVAMTGIKG
jgi:multiple sugar transport system permease protein